MKFLKKFFSKKVVNNSLDLELQRKDFKKDAFIFIAISMTFNMYSGWQAMAFFITDMIYDATPVFNYFFEKQLALNVLSVNAAGVLGLLFGFAADKVKSKGAHKINFCKQTKNKTGVILWSFITYGLQILSIFLIVFVGMQKASMAISDNDEKIKELENKITLHTQAFNILDPLNKTIEGIQASIKTANENIQTLINTGATKKEIRAAGYQLTDGKTGLNLMLTNAQTELSKFTHLQLNILPDDVVESIESEIKELKTVSPVEGFNVFYFGWFISWYSFIIFWVGFLIEIVIFASAQSITFKNENNDIIDKEKEELINIIEELKAELNILKSETNNKTIGTISNVSPLAAELPSPLSEHFTKKVEHFNLDKPSNIKGSQGSSETISDCGETLLNDHETISEVSSSPTEQRISISKEELEKLLKAGLVPMSADAIIKKYVFSKSTAYRIVQKIKKESELKAKKINDKPSSNIILLPINAN